MRRAPRRPRQETRAVEAEPLPGDGGVALPLIAVLLLAAALSLGAFGLDAAPTVPGDRSEIAGRAIG